MPDNLKRYNTPLYEETDEMKAIARIQANREYLKSITDWSISVLTLPDIFINEYQCDRFKFDKEGRYLRMICREKYLNLLYKKIDENKSE